MIDRRLASTFFLLRKQPLNLKNCKIKMLSTKILSNVNKIRNFSNAKRSFVAGKIYFNKSPSSSSPISEPSNVPGLTDACLKVSIKNEYVLTQLSKLF